MKTLLLILPWISACTWWAGDTGIVDESCDPTTVGEAAVLDALFAAHAIDCHLEALDTMIAARQATAGTHGLYLAESREDGDLALASNTPHIPRARSADLVLDDGLIYAFFVDENMARMRRDAAEGSLAFSTHGLPGWGAIRLATSEDGQRFTEVEGFALSGLPVPVVLSPDVFAMPAGGWGMHFLGADVDELLGDGPFSPNRLFFARSMDLVHWSVEGEVLEGPRGGTTTTCRPDGSCLLFSDGLAMGHSGDEGATWSHGEDWVIIGTDPDLAFGPEGQARLFYEQEAELRTLRSEDEGRSWTPEAGSRLPLDTGNSVGALILDNGETLLLVTRKLHASTILPLGAAHPR
jgi:hypothetical protein